MSQATFRDGCCIHSILHLKNVSPLVIFATPHPCCEILVTGLAAVNVTTISWVKFSPFG